VEIIICVLHDTISVDGSDATTVCERMITKTRHVKQLKAILFDGATMGGFNIIDSEQIWKKTKVPVITVTRKKPDFEKIELALKKHWKIGLIFWKKESFKRYKHLIILFILTAWELA